MASEVIPWRRHANGTVMLNAGGEVVADNTRASKKVVILYVPHGETIEFGMENPGGQLVSASAKYTAVGLGGKACLLKIRLHVLPNVPTVDAHDISAPGKTPDANEGYLYASMALPNNLKFWASVKVGNDLIRLCDEITAVASEPGTKCVVEMKAKILASRPIPPEPPPEPEEGGDPYVPPPKYSVPPDDDPPPWEN